MLTPTITVAEGPAPGESAGAFDPPSRARAAARTDACYHCGAPLRGATFAIEAKAFCCRGCLTVFELLTENGLDDFYRLAKAAGARVKAPRTRAELAYLDDPAVRNRLVDFADERVTHVTFRVPSMHCIACVWLLENLFRLDPGIGRSRVNFPKKEVSLALDNSRTTLAGAVALLASLGYEPDLKLSDLEGGARQAVSRRLWLQLGVAGFAFGNTMLLSISTYLGLDAQGGPVLDRLFGYISLALALPVIIYSAADYWRAAWLGVRHRMLTIEIPIAAGIVALAARSTYDVLTGRGPGYFDSLTGLLFFLLCGKLFQQKTFDRLAFDRDYKSFFPLAVARKQGSKEERVSLAQLQVGDRLVIRNGEIIPADARLVSEAATLDYSFVTGESEPVAKSAGDQLYAGGRQIGGAIEIETLKPVSQGYLTSLWNQPAFRHKQAPALDSLTNRYSRRFTRLVIAVALAATAFWYFRDASRALPAFTSVLIVACPCALALAAPFALGAAQRILARKNVFLKNTAVVESLARVDAVVFDKTGTLTGSGSGSIQFEGKPLSGDEEICVHSLARHSTHPYSARIAETTVREGPTLEVRSFAEIPGCGIEGVVDGRGLWMGSAAWLASRGVEIPSRPPLSGGVVHVVVNGSYRGCYALTSALRPRMERLMRRLSSTCELALLSGDNEKERGRFAQLFGPDANLHFNQSPLDKLGFIRGLQSSRGTVMMVGDGLNDAGALQQSDVGVAVVESIGAFSPASDVIMSAKMVPALPEILRFSRDSVRVVRLSFAISAVYNLAGISIAARGLLSPVVCAILMPLSSVTVVAFACGATHWLGRRVGGETGAGEGTAP